MTRRGERREAEQESETESVHRPRVRVSRKIRGALAVAAALAAGAGAAQPTWTLRAPAPDTTFVVSLVGADPAARALDVLHAEGRLQARVDSVRGDTVYATAGDGATVAALDVVGAGATPFDRTRPRWRTQTGGPFRPDDLAADLAATAAAYARAGYVGARLSPDVRVQDGGARVAITVRVDEGAPEALAGIELVGGRGAGRAFASRVAGVRAGMAVADVDLEGVRQALDGTGLYAAVGVPVLAQAAEGLVLQVPVVEAPPGAVDVVVGFLPPADGAPGQLVGSGRLDLRNLLGGGRAVSVELVRNPGLVSSFDVAVRDPFVFGGPVGLGARFEGTSRDSTFSRQRIAVDLAYPLSRSTSLVASASGEAVRPGTFGAAEVNGVPRVRRSDALYLGAGVVYSALDRPQSPRRGVRLAVAVEQGRPRRALGEALVDEGVQRRLTASGRAFVPLGGRHGAVAGAEATVRASTAGARFDEADLVRIGGARTLRGYDEDAFVGRVVGRALAEYRLHLDALTYAFAFGDLGYVDRPELADRPAERRVLPGYGAGLRLQTGLGLASVSYALHPDLPLGRGKVHVGLAVGL